MQKRMRKIIALFAVFFVLNVHAQESRESVKSTMRSMGAQFKILHLALIRGAETPDESVQAAADTLVNLIGDAAKKMPNHLRGDRAGELPVFDKLIGRLLEQAKNLQAALKMGDKAAAAQIMREGLVPIMREGHERFK
jgi:hypothetical protein